MKYFNQFPIRQRLLFMVCFAVIFYIGFSIYALYGINKVNSIVNTLIEHPLQVSNTALEAELSARELRDLLQEGVINPDGVSMPILVNEYKERQREIDDYFDFIQKYILREEGQQLAKETRLEVDKWLDTQDQVLQLILNGDFTSAKAHFNKAEEKTSTDVFTKIHQVNFVAKNTAEMLKEDAELSQSNQVNTLVTFMILFTLVLVILFIFTNRSIVLSLKLLKEAMAKSGTKNEYFTVDMYGRNEIVEMSKDYNKLIHVIKKQFLLMNGQTKLNDVLSGEITVSQLTNSVIDFLSEYVQAGQGVFYIFDKEAQSLKLVSSYAFTERENLSNSFRLGEGIVGQVGMEKKPILLKNIKKSDVMITTGTISEAPLNTFTFPLVYEQELYGVIELSSFEPIDETKQQFLLEAANIISINLFTSIQGERIKDLLKESQEANAKLAEQQHILEKQSADITEQNSKLKDLLDKSQRQAEELQVQQEELRQTNEELEQQTEGLRISEEKLQVQQEELRVTNEELEERARILESQKNAITEKNVQLTKAQKDIEVKAEQLEMTSKYKSEFLANMSHELRTPLNSILVLSQMLAEKGDTTPLTEKQLQFAGTIYSAGKDLLRLINDILDLSKVEAGKFTILLEKVKLDDLIISINSQFSEVALKQGLKLEIDMKNDLPEMIYTDRQRIDQIIKNLMSNALKFTEVGGVTLTIDRPTAEDIKDMNLDMEKALRISVKDTGIGIPKDKQGIIFEAFQQVDGTISRKFGGSGLGLSISRELAKLLHGKLFMHSEEGVGSTFTLIVPESIENVNEDESTEDHITNTFEEKDTDYKKPIENKPEETTIKKVTEKDINKYEKSLLIIEDDPIFIDVLTDLAEKKEFKYFVAQDGSSGVNLAKEKTPTAIILDITLPDMDGWAVLEQLQADETTTNIPVHVISGSDNNQENHRKGIISFLQKPVELEQLHSTFNDIESFLSDHSQNILIIDDDLELSESIASLFKEKGVDSTVVQNLEKAYERMKKHKYDGIILEIELQDKSEFSLLEKMKQDTQMQTPIIIHTRKEISPSEEEKLNGFSKSVIIKGERSKERLQAEATLFLHGIKTKIAKYKPKEMKSFTNKDFSFKGKKILLVDDDMRNIFAITSLLEEKGLTVIAAKNGKDGIEKLKNNSNVDLVLMDIMMPEMDGYTAMREIRKLDKINRVPIIALTAKAMKDDRNKCIEAGANDYLTKPVDNAKLLSLLRVWLYK